MVFPTIHLRAATNKYVPLIKFRYGPGKNKGLGGSTSKSIAAIIPSTRKAASTKSKPSIAKNSGPPIADYDLPARYRRKPIDKIEMEYINRGGPA